MGFGSSVSAAGPTIVSSLQLQSSSAGNAITIGYGQNRIAPNLMWYGDFTHVTTGSGGDKGGGGSGKSGAGGQVFYMASFQWGLCHGTISDLITVYNSKSADPLSKHPALSLHTGSYTQTASSYMTSKHPTQALNYRGIAYLEGEAFGLGQTAQLPNFNFEVLFGINTAWVGGPPDADPGAVVTDYLTNAHYGLGFPSANLGSLSVFSNYCIASGMTSSPVFDSVTSAMQQLSDYVKAHNAEFVWSGSTLTIVPYGDSNLSANGATYTAPSAPLYSLGNDDYIGDNGGKGPILISRENPQDRQNLVRLEWSDRSNKYAVAICEARDQADIEVHTRVRNTSTTTAHWFCRQAAAQMAATLLLQREAVRNIYTFTLGQKYIGLDPMDIVALNSSSLGLLDQWVRIRTIEEDDNGDLKITAEEYLGGTGAAPLYDTEPNVPFEFEYNADPGNVNTPFIYEPPPNWSSFNNYYSPEVWIGASGQNALWGGYYILMSVDGGVNYKQIGEAVTIPCRQGFLTAPFSGGSDPDTVNTCSVDLTESQGTLTSVSTSAADKAHTLCVVNNEIIAYSTATLTATNKYDLTTYIRRGLLGSTITGHGINTPFTRVDQAVQKISLPTEEISYVGQTVYFKFQSFNIYGGGLQDESALPAYSYTLQGLGAFVAPPGAVTITTDVIATADGSYLTELQIAWTAPNDTLYNAFEIQYAVHGGTDWRTKKVSKETFNHTIRNLPSGTAYDVRVRTVRNRGGPFFSAWVTATNYTVPHKTAAPNPPTSPTISTTWRLNVLGWTISPDKDVRYTNIYRNTVNTFGTATLINTHAGSWYHDDQIAPNTTYYYWFTAVDRSGNESAPTSSVNSTTPLAYDKTNMVHDPQFQEAAKFWTLVNVGSPVVVTYQNATIPPASANGTNSIGALTSVQVDTANIPAASSLNYGVESNFIEVGQSQWYRASCNAAASGAGVNKNAQLYINWYDIGQNFISTSNADGPQGSGQYAATDVGDRGSALDSGNGDVLVNVAQAPVGAYYARVFPAVYGGGPSAPAGTGSGWWFSKVKLERQVERTRLASAAVHREHIATGEVQTTHLAANAVTELDSAQVVGFALTTSLQTLWSWTAPASGVLYVVGSGNDTAGVGTTTTYELLIGATLVQSWSYGGLNIASTGFVTAGQVITIKGMYTGGTGASTTANFSAIIAQK